MLITKFKDESTHPLALLVKDFTGIETQRFESDNVTYISVDFIGYGTAANINADELEQIEIEDVV